LGWNHIHLLRTRRTTLPEDELAGLPSHTDIGAALAHRPAAVIIATPSSLHLDSALPAARAGCHLLIEKPLSHTLDRVDNLRQAVTSAGVQVLTGFQFRYHPGLHTLWSLLADGAIGPLTGLQVHWGEYLPSWHPWEDYRQSYAARADLGGGVVLTLCHPFDYLRWLFGEVVQVTASTSSRGGLGIDAEDTAEITLRFASGLLAQVHLDYLERPGSHTLLVTGRDGRLFWDARGDVRLSDQVFPAPASFTRDTMFLDEMRHFLACMKGREVPQCTLEDGIAALRIALAAKQSAAEGRAVVL
jgi:predicted dehydrogenase